MPSVASFVGTLRVAIEAELETLFSGVWASQGNDYTNDLEGFTSARQVLYSARCSTAEVSPDSNTSYEVVECEITVAWDLTQYPAQVSKTAERTLADSDLQTLNTTVMAPSWWRALSGVNDLVAQPVRVIERVGHVLKWDVAAQVSINPA